MKKTVLLFLQLVLVSTLGMAQFQMNGRLRLLKPVDIVVEDLNGKEVVKVRAENGKEFASKKVNLPTDLYKLRVGTYERDVVLTNDPLTFKGMMNDGDMNNSTMQIAGLKANERFESEKAAFLAGRKQAAAWLEKNTTTPDATLDPVIRMAVVQLHSGYLDNHYEPIRAFLDVMPVSSQKSLVYTRLESMIKSRHIYALGQPAWVFNFQDKEGRMHSLEDYRGKIVLVDCWASWCGPCRHEMKSLYKIYGEIKGDDLQFISISLDGDRDKWLKAAKEEQIPWLSLWEGISDPGKGAFDRSVLKEYYGFRTIPFIVLIDREGRIVKRFLRGEDVRMEIEKLRNK